MLTSADLVAFAATANPKAAIQFYRDVLKLDLVADEMYALVFNVNGTTLRIQKVESVQAVPYTTLGWSVDDIGETVAWLADAGVVLERFPNLDQADAGYVEFPGGGKVAWFLDPDGNRLSVTELPSSDGGR